MIGSISKIRPCGHHHYYKYAHSKNRADLKQVCLNRQNYMDDQVETVWGPFSLDGITTTTDAYATGIFPDKQMTKFVANMPNCTNFGYAFKQSTSLKEVDLIGVKWEQVTAFNSVFNETALTSIPDYIELLNDSCSIGAIFYQTVRHLILANNKIIPYSEKINTHKSPTSVFGYNWSGVEWWWTQFQLDDKYTFENAEDITSFLHNGWPYVDIGLSKTPPRLSFKNLVKAESAFYGNMCLTTFQTVDNMDKLENGRNMLGRCPKLSSLYPDYESFSLKSLSNGHLMFDECILDKSSIIKLSNALPDWSGDTTEHKITIGCHIDHKYDPDVNVALKQLDSNYTTPIEEYGSSLPTAISSFKRWTITVQWNGTKTDNAYPEPS